MVAPNPDPVPLSKADSPDASPPVETSAATVSERKLAANRANAAQSTGPTSIEGKSRSRLNATRHGFRAELPVERCPQLEEVGDDPNAFDDLHEAFVHDLKPRGAAEQLIVERLARAAWRLRRTEAAEIGLLDTAERGRVQHVIFRHVISQAAPHLHQAPHSDEMQRTPLGKALAGHFTERGKGGGLLTLMQYQARLEGQVRSCLRDLRLLREDRAAWLAQQEGEADWSPPLRPRRKPRLDGLDVGLEDLMPDIRAEVERAKKTRMSDAGAESTPRLDQQETQQRATELTPTSMPTPESAPLPPTPTPASASMPAPPRSLAEASDVTPAPPPPATNEATRAQQHAATNEATAGVKSGASEVVVAKTVTAKSASPAAPPRGTNEATAKPPPAPEPPAAPPWHLRPKRDLPAHLTGW